MGPFDRHAGSQMSDRRFGGIIRSLGLRNVDNAAGHAANKDHRSVLRAPFHQVLSYTRREQVGAVDVDCPDLPHALVGVCFGRKVLGEAGRRDQVINLAMSLDDACQCLVDAIRVGDITPVSGNLGRAGIRVGRLVILC